MDKLSLEKVRSARIVAVVVVLSLAATLSLSLAAGSAPAQSPGEGFLWVMHIQGGVVRTTTKDNHATNPEDVFKSTSVSKQTGVIDFYFEVNSDGSITPVGTPTGRYEELSWHLNGVNGEATFDEETGITTGGEFDCTPPVTGADFTPEVSGTATDTRMVINVDLPDASETNEEMDCGGGFMAYATTSQYLRESLTFCGAFRRPYTVIQTGACRKSPPPEVVGNTERMSEHSWDFTMTRTNGPSPTSSPSSSQSPGPTPSTNPSMSPPGGGASPSPTPIATPSSHARVSLMVFRKHLRSFGAVMLVGWGAAECVDSVPVKIQRRLGRPTSSFWSTVKTVQTTGIGAWSTKLKDTPGDYRALAPEVVKDMATCKQATSKVKKHRHGG